MIENTLSHFFIPALFKGTRAFSSFTPFLFSRFHLFIKVPGWAPTCNRHMLGAGRRNKQVRQSAQFLKDEATVTQTSVSRWSQACRVLEATWEDTEGLTWGLTFKLRPEEADYLKGGGQSDLWSRTACAKALGWERGCQRDKGRALGQTAWVRREPEEGEEAAARPCRAHGFGQQNWVYSSFFRWY